VHPPEGLQRAHPTYTNSHAHLHARTCTLQKGLPADQKSVAIFDCWPVHKSLEFLDYLKCYHPTIIPIFVPANCTGKFQVGSRLGWARWVHGSCMCLACVDQAIELLPN